MPQELERVRYSHEALADIIIANPTIRQSELAVLFGRTQAWVGCILNSDAFQAYLAQRREDIIDPVLRMTTEERLRALTTKSIDVVMEKLYATPDVNVALKSLEIVTKSLGYGARAAVVVNNTNAAQNNFSQRPQLTKEEWLEKFGSATPVVTSGE